MTCFSIERWLAICYPLKHKSFSSCYRATIAIIGVWILSFVMASPVLQIVVINKLRIPFESLTDPSWLHPSITSDGHTIIGTDFCAMDFDDHLSQMIFILGAFFGFFIFPAVVITVLYAHIMTTIRKSDQYLTTDQQQNARNKKIIKMLLAVVVTFFICWTPFHLQRILAIYVTNLNPTPSEALTKLYNYIFYCSGYFYYSNSALNPVLYNIMSTRYRRAFKNTIMFPFPSCKDRIMVKANSLSKPRSSVSRMSTFRFSMDRGINRHHKTNSSEDTRSTLIRHGTNGSQKVVLAKVITTDAP
uniref:G_PROTEIN_RECEP_F1_2 domain-containing protein n=2 Tax=Bursaphelenchus xylophilus TaxID=6326 RepID=A0A1I7SHF7_BURXY